MKAFAQHRNRFNRVLCCVLSFTLAFYTLGAPAYAAEATEASSTNTAAAQQATDSNSAQKTDTTDQQAKASDENADVADKDAKADDAAKALDQQAEVVDELSVEPETDADQITVASEDGDENDEGNENGEDNDNGEGNDNELPDDFEYEKTPDPEHSVSVSSSFDADTLIVTYTVTVDNSKGNTPLNAMVFEGYEMMGEEGYASFSIASPEGWNLGPAKSDTFTVAHKLALDPTTDVPVKVNLKAKAVAENSAYAVGESDIECLMPRKAHDYTVDTSSFVVDEDGNKRGVDEYALPGDIIYFIFTVRNTGTEELTFTANPVGEGFEAVEGSDGYASWGASRVLASDDQVTFAVSYAVSTNDLNAEDSEADTSITAMADITTVEGTKGFSVSSVKIMESFYQYYVFFAIDTEDEELAGQIADLDIAKKQNDAVFTWPVDYIEENCPEGFVPRYSVMSDDELVAVDPATFIDLTHDEKQNCFYVDYVPAPEAEQAPYIVNYYIDSVDGIAFDAVTGSGSIGDAIPVDVAGKRPEGFKADATITGPETIGASKDGSENTVSVVYERDSFSYTINYFKSDSTSAVTSLGSVQGEKAPFESTVTLTKDQLNAMLPSSGYPELEVSNAYSVTISADEASNVIDVTYAPSSYTYSIDYYTRNSDGVVEFLGSTLGAPTLYGTVITVSTEQLNAKLPTGYKSLAASDAYTLSISDDVNANRIEVVYEPDVFSYTIKFYRDNAIDDAIHMAGEALVGEALYGSKVHVDIEMLNRNLPEIGFKAKGADDEFDIVITEDAASNSYNVIYDRAEYGYVINYYQDAVAPENLLGSSMGNYYYGYDKYPTIAEINQYVPDGYKRIYENLYVTITSPNMDDNVLNIVYDQKVDDIGFTVNYYKDSISEENLLGSDAGTGLFNATIPYEMGKYAPAGYDANGTVDGNTVISLDESTNVVNIVYAKGKFGYTVNYYKDGVSDENRLGQQTGSAELGETISYENGLYAPEEGYDLANTVTSGQSIVTASPEDNVLNVIYSRQANLTWRVNYYLGAVSGSPVASITGFGTYGDEIVYDADAYVEDGYTLPAQVSGDTKITNVNGESVLNVVYPAGRFGYIVNYYRDSISEENLLGTDADTGLFGTNIPYEQGKYAPIGYRNVGYTNGTLTVGYDSDSNVLNVVYLYESYGYTVNYYVGSVASDNLIASVSDPDDLRPYGGTVELRPSQMNAHRPAGYAEVTEPVSFEITDNVATNGCNVVFNPDFGEFYTAGVPAVTATYDGTTHTVMASGVHEGDIITYSYNGTTETRTVGIDPYIGVEFQDVTDGAIPVTIMVTRAGIASDAVQTTVSITPAVPNEPSTPQNPIIPNTPVTPGATDVVTSDTNNTNSSGTANVPATPATSNGNTPSQSGGNSGAEAPTQDDNSSAQDEPTLPASINQIAEAVASSPLGQLVDRLVSYVDPGIDVPEPTTAELDMDGDQDASSVESIDDDVNPLAASPVESQNALSGIVSTLSFVLASLSALASAVLLLIKLSIASRMASMASTASVAIKSRSRITTRLLIAFVSLAVVLYGVWLILIL